MNDNVCSMHVVIMKVFKGVSKSPHDSAVTPFCYSDTNLVVVGLDCALHLQVTTKFTTAGIVAGEYQWCFLHQIFFLVMCINLEIKA